MPDPDVTAAIAEITQSNLETEVENLRQLARDLEAFAAGDDAAWTTAHTLTGHAILVRAQSHVTGARSLRHTVARRNSVVLLNDRR